MNENGNEDQQRDNQQQGQVGLYPSIEDEEEWLRRNGLLSEDSYGQGSERNQREAHERFHRQRQYQQRVHERVFRDDLEKEVASTHAKRQQLDRWHDAEVMVKVATSASSYEIPLHFLASLSDTVYAMATSPATVVMSSSPARKRHKEENLDCAIEEANRKGPSENGAGNNENGAIHLSLEEFDDGAVLTFLKVITKCCHGNCNDIMGKDVAASTPAQGKPSDSESGGTNDTAESARTKAKRSKPNQSSSQSTAPAVVLPGEDKHPLVQQVVLTEIPDHHMIDCCRLAHYLQCTPVLDAIVRLCLIPSVDTANCLSLVQLADSLELTNLMEASLSHMMQSLTNLEQHQVWDDLSPELKDRIETIRMLLTQSHPRHAGSGAGGSKLSKLYFTSFQEYLAIFAEQVEYYRERLHDAKMDQERYVEESIRGSVGHGWKYAQEKIDIHERRVNSLRELLAQQKRLFSMSSPK